MAFRAERPFAWPEMQSKKVMKGLRLFQNREPRRVRLLEVRRDSPWGAIKTKQSNGSSGRARSDWWDVLQKDVYSRGSLSVMVSFFEAALAFSSLIHYREICKAR
jgi:hypothetical protein